MESRNPAMFQSPPTSFSSLGALNCRPSPDGKCHWHWVSTFVPFLKVCHRGTEKRSPFADDLPRSLQGGTTPHPKQLY